MVFIPNFQHVALEAMTKIDPTLACKYNKVICFLAAYPDAASAMRGTSAPSIGSTDYIVKNAANFSSARMPRIPKPPSTIPDEMVSIILSSYFNVSESDVERIKTEHLLSMGAENLVGDLLERYLASVMEPRGWVWCSGAMVRAVDFIKPPSSNGGSWTLLQVKNRDNSENSSSSAIRLGTTIDKWHRTFSRKEGSNWSNFPDISLRQYLSEDGFKAFVGDYLRSLR
ncbi:SinI family restriction endonuclease [Dickeya zeae]|uniref:SinI family restriction endonuclease n=1 Tax=Dickeya zeae TaxID=204042 RepID=UPI0008FC05DE|nr:SinI family restriction endonuclease [Dickeya zeae]